MFRSLILAPVAALAAAAALALPALAAPIPLAELSRYLNGIDTLQAAFTQINPDGTIATGTIRIDRPGRVRFEYAPPDKTLVLSDGQQVAIFDPKSNQPPEQYPLRRTPLNLILGSNVDLGAAKMVVGHREEGPATHVIAQDPEHPEYGTIEMVFTPAPVELRQWIITDDAGGRTTLVLGEGRRGGGIDRNLFNIAREMELRGMTAGR